MFELGVDVPSEKWVFQLGWVLKKFQVGRYKFQVGVGGKTWKCGLIKVETATNRKNKACVRVEKLRGMFQCKTAFFHLEWKFPP